MKFLVDNQLPLALCRFLSERGRDSIQVLEIGLNEAKDSAIWKYASDNGRAVIAKDEDFLRYAMGPDASAAFVWVRLRNCRNSAFLAAFDRLLPAILSALESGQRIVELR